MWVNAQVLADLSGPGVKGLGPLANQVDEWLKPGLLGGVRLGLVEAAALVVVDPLLSQRLTPVVVIAVVGICEGPLIVRLGAKR